MSHSFSQCYTGSNEAQAPMVPDSKTTKFVSQILHAVVANADVATYYIVLFRHYTKYASLCCMSLLYLLV